MSDVITTDYDGCGMCFVATRRLSRTTDSTSSPERQANQIIDAVSQVGGHIIAWADDWEVSGATDPMTRKGLGPWLQGKMGPYDGIAAASVDRAGRNVRDVLNTQELLTSQGRKIVTADHVGVWDFSNVNDENEWMLKAWGSQMELRAIQKRNRDETLRARAAGQPKQRPSYGYMYVRVFAGGKVDHVEIDPVGAEIIRTVAERILTDETGKITCATEAARLNREGVPSPGDRRAQLYGREQKGSLWTAKTVKLILTSEAALGYLMHDGAPVIGEEGQPRRIAEPLWEPATRDALITATAIKRTASRAPKGTRLLSGIAFCGTCGMRLYIAGRKGPTMAYGCTARVRGIATSQHCKPAPGMYVDVLDQAVADWFLVRFGAAEVMRKVYDPGTGYAARIAELEKSRTRLRDDRQAGLYDSPAETEWFQANYTRMSREITELQALPERAPGMRMMPTGVTVAQQWEQASDDAARREVLNQYDVRVVLHPRRRGEKTSRYEITGINSEEWFPAHS
ncbi:site-specific DNA recombinase [Kitasatospora sp. GP30]|uniref:recombinase family protein n=1 Tax=Kitasatospora sp. GP30 TaxID=3035084 RepID=UPI000CC776E2|nr:recombinase family protein [Kitasatospora sp. GP30]MDH6139595.1 site-specific DNA recombinase [Kitasatospora sp. GP30]